MTHFMQDSCSQDTSNIPMPPMKTCEEIKISLDDGEFEASWPDHFACARNHTTNS